MTATERAVPDVGETLPALSVRLTRASLVRYAGAANDFNPIHYSEHFAERVGLPGVVAHGMLTLGLALRAVTDWLGDPGPVRSCFARFTRPVVVPDDEDGAELMVTATVLAVEGSRLSLGLEAVCAGQKVLGSARVDVDLAG